MKQCFPHQSARGGARSVDSECTSTSTRIPDRSSTASSSHFDHDDEGDILDVSWLYACTPQEAGADLRPQGLHAETQEEDITDVSGLYVVTCEHASTTHDLAPPLREKQALLPAVTGGSDHFPKCDDAVYCDCCRMWLNGPTQWEDHKIGRKHKKYSKAARPANATPTPKDKGIEIPRLTAALIEQSALWHDAVCTYCLSVYRRAALRSRI
jgi:hypothetical protein